MAGSERTIHAHHTKLPEVSYEQYQNSVFVGLDLMLEEDCDRKEQVPGTVNFRIEDLWLFLQQDMQLHPSLTGV